jgi:murein DD-endopeptidase MepM/ murein hydrolase activator NlpD/Mg-chelatase subunit ChlD
MLRICKFSFRIFLIVFLLFTAQFNNIHLFQPQTVSAAQSVDKIALQAPWPEGVTFHVGRDGSFYNDCDPINDKYHCGYDQYAIDINGTGTDGETNDDGVMVFAAADGEVVFSGNNNDGYGNSVVIAHVNRYQTRYAHLSGPPLVEEGAFVTVGTPLGHIGNTGGTSTGKHLHFAVYHCDTSVDESKCNSQIVGVRPEPFGNQTVLTDGMKIISSNYSVGYERFTDIKDQNSGNYHQPISETYKQLGNTALEFNNEIINFLDLISWPVDYVKQLQGQAGLYYQEFFSDSGMSVWGDDHSVILEDLNTQQAFFIAGPIWKKYQELSGTTGSLGMPVDNTYNFFNFDNLGLRQDFENGSIVWSGTDNPEVYYPKDALWKGEFYPGQNLVSGTPVYRRDKSLAFNWPNANYSGPLSNTEGFTAKWTIKDQNLINITKFTGNLQGYLILKVNGKVVLQADSPEQQRVFSTNFKASIGQQTVEVIYSQAKDLPGSIELSVQGIIPPAFAAEEAFTNGILPAPDQDYATFTPPSFPENSNSTTPTVETTTTALVFDTSGSMADLDASGISKIEAARNAGAQIANVIQAENDAMSSTNQVGIVKYSTYVAIAAPLSSDMPSVLSALNTLEPEESTAMADGLKTGIDLFSTTQGKKILILLSDGLPNIGLNTDPSGDIDLIKQQVLDLASSAGQDGICIYTIGFGDATAGVGSIDESFLQEIAVASGCGHYYNAQNAIDLANIYIELRHTSTGDVLFNQSGQIDQGQEIDLGVVTVDQNQETMLFTLNWPGSRLEPTLIDPVGITVDQNYPGAAISTTSSLVSIIVNEPQAGDWKVRKYPKAGQIIKRLFQRVRKQL